MLPGGLAVPVTAVVAAAGTLSAAGRRAVPVDPAFGSAVSVCLLPEEDGLAD